MEKVIITKTIVNIVSNSNYSVGEILFSIMSKLKITKKSELLAVTDKDILHSVEEVERLFSSKDERMTDKEFEEWLNKK